MNNKKKKILINLLVICLYFIWPYLINSVNDLLNISKTAGLYITSVANFIFLFIIIHIYKDTLNNYCKKFKKNINQNLLNSLKIFFLGLVLYITFNVLIGILDVPVLGSQSSRIEIFKKIPIMFILNTIFYYPIIEEFVFKLSLKEILKNKWTFIIITGLLNAFFQIVFSISNISDLLYLIPYTIFFSSLSYIYYKTENITYPILFRMCYNLIPCTIYIIDLLR